MRATAKKFAGIHNFSSVYRTVSAIRSHLHLARFWRAQCSLHSICNLTMANDFFYLICAVWSHLEMCARIESLQFLDKDHFIRQNIWRKCSFQYHFHHPRNKFVRIRSTFFTRCWRLSFGILSFSRSYGWWWDALIAPCNFIRWNYYRAIGVAGTVCRWGGCCWCGAGI